MSTCETQVTEKERLGAAAQLLLQKANDLFSCPAAVDVHPRQPEPPLGNVPPKNDKTEAKKGQDITEWEPDDSFELL